ncbi:phosphoglycerate kinase [candidate division KSB1 bacterium 4484_87]|nr:MAG: phosphoglycerate kinase [candidate division KSB1 bacterium 4484_87]
MKKLTIDDLRLDGKRVLVRVDFNVPLDENLKITDNTRIKAALPTIKKIIDSGGKAILMSHLGRPKGKVIEKMRMEPVAEELSRLLGKQVKYVNDCIGKEVEAAVSEMKNGDVLLLENLRFHEEETKNEPQFAKKLARLGDVYINDAFGTAHRAHASTEGVTKYFDQCAAGYLIEKELKYLGGAIESPKRPLVAILGGAKISGKIDVIDNLLEKVDALLIGGGMSYTFLKANNIPIGNSLLEADKIDLAKQVQEKAAAKGVALHLPVDHVIADEISENAAIKTTDDAAIPDGWAGVDIGPKTIANFENVLSEAKTVVWNGPMGVFEIDAFAKGTIRIAEILAKITQQGAITVIGGGDSSSALKKAGKTDQVTHVSTGGGASLEFLGGIKLPGIEALTDK